MTETRSALPKTLHVGVVREGRFIEDRWFKGERPVTIGTGGKNTFAFPLSGLSHSQPLFAHKQGKLVLRFDESARGKIRVNELRELDLAECRQIGLAAPAGGAFEMPLNDEMRGHITLGEVSFVFNFSTPPPTPRRPVLPREARGSIWSVSDPAFLSILCISFALHGCMIAAVSRRDLPPETTVDDIPDRIAKILMPEKRPEDPPKEEEKPVAAAKPKEALVERAQKKPAAPKDSLQHKQDVADTVRDLGLNRLIAKDHDGKGAIDDVFNDKSSFAEIDDALKTNPGLGIATTAPVKPKGADAGRKIGIGDLQTGGPIGSAPRLRENADVAPGLVKVTDQDVEVDSPGVDKEALAKFIQQRLASIRGCYEAQLKRSPNLRGKLVIQFTITAGGAVSEASAAEDAMGSDPVTACILRQIKMWRTPFRSSSDVTVSFPFLFSPAN